MKKLERREFLTRTLAFGGAAALSTTQLKAANANSDVNLGFISCGGRAGQLMGQFSKVDGVNIAGLCDPDENRLGLAKQRFPKAEGWSDLRDLIESDTIDAVVVATCNHWHCLAAIWAMQAGKDVYVEKPLSHSQWEGKQTVAAARKYNRICQLGTQQRSDPMQTEIKKFLHEERGLGNLIAARVNRYGIRPSIGKRNTPLPIDKNLAYDLWLGPAQDQPIYRKALHYDWHWDWNTGSGEMGNWGVHVLDDVRNNVFQDAVSLPKRILGGGGRVALNDAGQSPNVHFAYFDTGTIPVVIGLSNLPAEPGGKKSPAHPGPSSGYVVYCEGGRYEGQRGRGVAYDYDGKVIREFRGNGDVRHQQNFIDAVRAQDRSILNAEVEVGNDSTGWCNLANVAVRCGNTYSADTANGVQLDQWKDLLGEMGQHLQSHNLSFDDDSIKLSPMLELSTETETFTGDYAASANQFLKREYRSGFEVPEIT
ncbi:Gfo/Idh/MocA family oxidoreductase [bacterium]|nr:Gfo/Idh/MocA family oxidoreductase [bacterium]